MTTKKFTTQVGGRDFTIEVGHLAGQANGAVLAQYGLTSVLVTATMAQKPKDADYFPLIVDYEERFYAAGKIKGSRWVKRETRPSEEAILTARLIDRALRPRFDQRIRNEVQIVVTVLSFDGQNDPDIPALVGASTALMISDIPFDGPVAASRVGMTDKDYLLNPVYGDREKSKFDLVVAGTKDRINMIEAGANIVDEKIMIDAIDFGFKEYQDLIEFQKKIAKEVGLKKAELEVSQVSEDLVKEAREFLESKLEKAVYTADHNQMKKNMAELRESFKEFIEANRKNEPDLKRVLQQAEHIFEDELDVLVHKNVLEKDKRPDGRKTDEVRKLSVEIGVLPRNHGSALFTRGQTQALSILTLGAPGSEQWIEIMEYNLKKRFMHHYNFPPFSSGETGRVGFPGRREIGHGALAERALFPVIPEAEKFPYTVRAVTEILSSNGSTSMASVCASCLALMDGGVPIKDTVAGISMGLILGENGKFKVLTDIQGPEDHHGDMDFKIAGTKEGITGLQMDVKVEGITREIVEKVFEQSRKARHEILGAMAKVIDKPKTDLSPFAPRVYTLQINPDKIRAVIGTGGKVINEIIAATNATIDIEDSGLIFVTAENEESANKAIDWIKNLTKEIKVGEIFSGKVVRIVDFGAFVELTPNQDGLVHISEISEKRIDRVSDVLKLGDVVPVKVKKIDDYGKISLTMRFSN